jgi:CheY-like chemotaxis protein
LNVHKLSATGNQATRLNSKLVGCSLQNTPVTDLTPLYRLKNLRWLDIASISLSEEQVMRGQTGLHNAILIAMTGYGHESDRQRSLAAGFDHHLVKPIHFEKVQEILATVSQE